MTIEIKIPYKKHSKHISYEYEIRTCKVCGESYHSIRENFIGSVSGKKMSHRVYDQSKPYGNNPFITHIMTHRQ
jgi:hypothetical protein